MPLIVLPILLTAMFAYGINRAMSVDTRLSRDVLMQDHDVEESRIDGFESS